MINHYLSRLNPPVIRFFPLVIKPRNSFPSGSRLLSCIIFAYTSLQWLQKHLLGREIRFSRYCFALPDKGYIIDRGVKTDYSVTEMKSRILEITNINEKPQTKATSLIYRYAIFTAQEMMKQILTENQDRRLEILRRALGIDEYSTAR